MTPIVITTDSINRDLIISEKEIEIFEQLFILGKADLPLLHFLLRLKFGDGAGTIRSLKERLRTLDQVAHCIHTFHGGSGGPPIYALLDRGLAIRQKHNQEEVRRTTQPGHRDAERIRGHEIGLAEYLVTRQLWSAQEPHRAVVSHRDIFGQVIDPRIYQRHQWPVYVTYEGKTAKTHVKPDYVALVIGIEQRERADVTEYDEGTETKLPSRFNPKVQSILGKHLSHIATMEDRLLEEYLGTRRHNVEFVFRTRQRRDSVIELAKDVVPAHLTQRFFYAVKPERPSQADDDGYATMEWFDARGQQVTRFANQSALF